MPSALRFRPSLQFLESREVPAYLVTAPGAGGVGLVRVFDTASGELRRQLLPFGGFTGGVSVASGDLNADGVPDVVAAAGPGGGPHVVAYDGSTFEPLASFFAYDGAFIGGVNVAVGDVDADGYEDIVTGTGAGGGPHVKAFSGKTGAELTSFFAYDPTFTGGVSVAAGDLDAGGRAEIFTGAGVGGGPHVKAFALTAGGPTEVAGLFAFDPAFTGGVSVAAGDVNGDGRADVVAGAGAGGTPRVRAFSLAGGGAAVVADLFAYDPTFRGGVRVAATDLSGDGRADLFTGPGAGGGPHARGFDAASGAELANFFPYDPAFAGGLFVAGGGQRELRVDPESDLGPANVTDLGELGAAPLSAGGSVSAARPYALFRFTVPTAGAARVDLTGLTADADVQLVRDLDADGQIDGDDVVADSARPGTAAESLTAGVGAGAYFVRVLRYDGDTPFSLRVSRAVATAGGADDLGMLGSRRLTGQVTEAEPEADYRFTLSRPADFTATLTGLTADADLILKADPDGDGVYAEVSRSELPGTETDRLSERLGAGSYLVLVRRYAGSTPFTLDLQATLIPQPGVTGLGTFTGTPISRSGSVDAAGPEDLYQFSLAAERSVRIDLTGLTADADLYLLGGSSPTEGVELARSVAEDTADDSVVVTLPAGTFFIAVRRYEGSPRYTLTVRPPAAGDSPVAVSSAGSRRAGSGLVQADRAVGLAVGRTLTSRSLAAADGDNFRDLNLIRAGGAWAAGATGRGVVVAVIDTGVNTAHRDLAGSVVDAAAQYDFVFGDAVPDDGDGHGSHVAGIIGANRDGVGITGVAYDATIMPLRVLDDEGSGRNADVAAAIDYAVNRGAGVINLSLGGSSLSAAIQAAIRRANDRGVVVVAAAGNDGTASPDWPARLAATLPNVIAAGAVNATGTVATFSNGAGNPLLRRFVVAPGVSVKSLDRTGDGTASVMTGTSMAVPHVAGVAALVRSANPNLSAAQVVDILTRSAAPLPISP